ncbi:hypothetical protein BHE74_00032226 [Ensete ventricosum]|nr:hypothetical protein GW17_00062520 [Ensete ventricosum]RWW60755.1 hypothetical protein BHE74_00032226 [Ensete ventricosum]RZS20007.1 hypothetical protein BHM03_00052477 [Ensete ventricosum]
MSGGSERREKDLSRRPDACKTEKSKGVERRQRGLTGGEGVRTRPAFPILHKDSVDEDMEEKASSSDSAVERRDVLYLGLAGVVGREGGDLCCAFG